MVWTRLWSTSHHLGHYFDHVAHNGGGGDDVNHVNGGDNDKVCGGGASGEDLLSHRSVGSLECDIYFLDCLLSLAG